MSGKLTSFAGSGESLKQGGKARPFGAPDSDGDADDSGRTDDDSASDEDKSTKASPERDEAKAPVDEKRKLKLQRGKFENQPPQPSEVYRTILM